MSKRIDLAWMIRNGRATPGFYQSGVLSWSCGNSPAGSISYFVDMCDLDAATLRLSYSRETVDKREQVNQTIRLVYTQPNFGGRRWWMVCPFRYNRVAKLYLPSGGDRFAGRAAWRLGYQSQRDARRDRPFEKLFRLQKKLGSSEGWQAGLRRPKGMWHRTYERHFERYLELDDQCSVEMAGVMAAFGRRL